MTAELRCRHSGALSDRCGHITKRNENGIYKEKCGKTIPLNNHMQKETKNMRASKTSSSKLAMNDDRLRPINPITNYSESTLIRCPQTLLVDNNVLALTNALQIVRIYCVFVSSHIFTSHQSAIILAIYFIKKQILIRRNLLMHKKKKNTTFSSGQSQRCNSNLRTRKFIALIRYFSFS